jgi:hypothetical protein
MADERPEKDRPAKGVFEPSRAEIALEMKHRLYLKPPPKKPPLTGGR